MWVTSRALRRKRGLQSQSRWLIRRDGITMMSVNNHEKQKKHKKCEKHSVYKPGRKTQGIIKLTKGAATNGVGEAACLLILLCIVMTRIQYYNAYLWCVYIAQRFRVSKTYSSKNKLCPNIILAHWLSIYISGSHPYQVIECKWDS